MSRFMRASAFIAATMIITYGMVTTRDHASAAWLIILLISATLMTMALWPHLPKSVPSVQRTVTRGTVLFMVGFLILGVQLARIQVIDSAEISAQTASAAGDLVVQDPRVR